MAKMTQIEHIDGTEALDVPYGGIALLNKENKAMKRSIKLNTDARFEKYSHIFNGLVLPVKPALAADSARVALIEVEQQDAENKPFFGGYAEDMLADIGFDMVEDMPEGVRAKRV
jgi:hypothetical protein